MSNANHRVVEALHADGEFVVSRILGEDGQTPLLLVSPAVEPPSRASLARLERAYSLRAQLDPAYCTRPLALRQVEGRMSLIMEDPGGCLLTRMVGQPMKIALFLRLAAGISKALANLHARGIVHMDIRPANIFVKVASGQAIFTGFGFSSRVLSSRQSAEPPEAIAGSLAYMAPEQTGRMNRSVDSRSDLYSLGITFYEMLVGALPFSASDPMEWVHCHLARSPESPHTRINDIPKTISAIVMRLLAKAAEARYQTATGLHADLLTCLTGWEANGRIRHFRLATRDASDRLVIPEKLYGRDKQIKILLTAFDRVVRYGAAELILVSGYSGVGKSSVVNELQKALAPSRGLFASGKCDQYQRDVPYATLAQAFRHLIRYVLGLGETDLKTWREELTDALGANGQLMVNLIPELELIIGRQPANLELSAPDAKVRFQGVLLRLINVFAKPEHPLTLFIDDLQWLDDATLTLLRRLSSQPRLRSLLLIGAYRDNEAAPSRHLLETLDEIRRSGFKVQDIALTNLTLQDLIRLLAETLHCKFKNVRSFAELLREKTGGNPFFAIQFLTKLHLDGLLQFDPAAMVWTWDIDLLRRKSLTKNVVDVMVGKLNRLPDSTLNALKTLACLGIAGRPPAVEVIYGQTGEQLLAHMCEPIQLGLISHSNGVYTFQHDRIQEAAYALIPEEERAAKHLAIGRLLASRLDAAEIEENVFDIVNQLNRGLPLITLIDERERVAELNLMAGQRASGSSAYPSALSFLSIGGALIGEQTWERRYRLAFELKSRWAACAMHCGHFDESERLIGELLARAKSREDKVVVHQLEIELHILKSENVQAVKSALRCLALFGVQMRPHPDRAELDLAFEEVWSALAGRSIESLVDLPLAKNQEFETVMGMLAALLAPAYYTDEVLTCLHLCRMVTLTLTQGITAASAHAFAWFGVAIGHIYGRYADGFRFGELARSLVGRHAFAAFDARTLFALHMAALWAKPVTYVVDTVRAAFRTAAQTGFLTIAYYSSLHTTSALLLRGDHLDEVWRDLERGGAYTRPAHFQGVNHVFLTHRRFIQNLRGRTASLLSFDGDGFDETKFEAELMSTPPSSTTCLYLIIRAKAHFIFGDLRQAAKSLKRARPFLWSIMGLIQNIDYHFFSALCLLGLSSDRKSGEEAPALDEDDLRHSCELVELWAHNCPATFADKHALVRAEIARLEGRSTEAGLLYDRAIRLARENSFRHYEAISHEAAARFYMGRGDTQTAFSHLRDARACYEEWGALGKTRQLDQLYFSRQEGAADASSYPSIDHSLADLDLAGVVKMSQAVSEELVLDRLIERFMTIALQQAGAGRGVLLLSQSDERWVRAEATTHEKTLSVRVCEMEGVYAELPESILRYVIRCRDSIILDDSAMPNQFSADDYIQRIHPRSVLCIPMVKQTRLVGVLYLENNLSSHVFTPARITVLQLLISQAAISLENARLYTDLQKAEGQARQSEREIRQAMDSIPSLAWVASADGSFEAFNKQWNDYTGISTAAAVLGGWDLTLHPEDAERVSTKWRKILSSGAPAEFEARIRRHDEEMRWFLIRASPLRDECGKVIRWYGTNTDIEELRQKETSLRKAMSELAHVSRVSTIGELAASIVHEVSQPISSVIINGTACQQWLAGSRGDPPNLGEARESILRVVRDGTRAREVIARVRALVKKAEGAKEPMDINKAILDVITLARSELETKRVALNLRLARELPQVHGDRVQLQQVLLNLILNGIDAMSSVENQPRELVLETEANGPAEVEVTICDSGVGIDPADSERIFDAFHTTKAGGLGMGLSISRTIINNHGGRLWVVPRKEPGACLRFTIASYSKTDKLISLKEGMTKKAARKPSTAPR